MFDHRVPNLVVNLVSLWCPIWKFGTPAPLAAVLVEVVDTAEPANYISTGRTATEALAQWTTLAHPADHTDRSISLRVPRGKGEQAHQNRNQPQVRRASAFHFISMRPNTGWANTRTRTNAGTMDYEMLGFKRIIMSPGCPGWAWCVLLATNRNGLFIDWPQN